jgi:hypothetical protein
MTKIDYDKLTDDEATDILKADFGSRLIEDRQTEIISAPDVLYYADAYGDLETAILLQSWDKSLPDRVHKGLVDSGLDIYEAVNNHDLETQTCPSCDSDMWEFQIQHSDTYTETHWVDEHGEVEQRLGTVCAATGKPNLERRPRRDPRFGIMSVLFM